MQMNADEVHIPVDELITDEDFCGDFDWNLFHELGDDNLDPIIDKKLNTEGGGDLQGHIVLKEQWMLTPWEIDPSFLVRKLNQ